MSTIPELYEHQRQDIDFLLANSRALNFSDCGTGKTRTAIEVIRARKHEGRTLIIAPKSILAPAWGADLARFAPELTYTIAYADNRARAFAQPSNIVITNHDAVTWIARCVAQRTPILDGFTQLIVDESSAFRNSAQRTQALTKLRNRFNYRLLMSGTPYVNSLTDVWRQALICDDGKRLGNSFFAFRSQVCAPRTVGHNITVWDDKPGMDAVVQQLLADITIRHRLEDCIDIPQKSTSTISFDLSRAHRELYERFYRDAVLEFDSGDITANNAAIRVSKLLQILSGAVYDDAGAYKLLDTDRYELIAQLAIERPQSIIAFRWTHQKDRLLKLIDDCELIDGTVPIHRRNQIVADYQAGNIKVLLIHPRAGAHGLTLTAGHDTIWASPTYSSEEFVQLNHRIYRAGQTKKTRTLLVTAAHTIEPKVYDQLQNKLTRADSLLKLFDLVPQPEAA